MEELKPSGIQWIGDIPLEWNIAVLGRYVKQVKNKNSTLSEVNLLSLSYGKIKRKNINANEGLLPATVDGLVSPAYVVAKPKIEVNSSFVEYVLRTPNAIEHIRGLSYGVADFRLRLYWPYFKNIKIPLPPIEEQNKIVSYIQDQSNKMEALISEKQSLIEDLKAYKKSLIYEVVTGKRRVV